MQKKKKEIIDSLKINDKDVGSSEVQIGLLSEKINHLTEHFKINKNDKHSATGLLKAVNLRKPHLFATQLLDLANAYNGFYRDCHILVEGVPNPFYLQVSETARNLLRTGMQGIGIIPLEQM